MVNPYLIMGSILAIPQIAVPILRGIGMAGDKVSSTLRLLNVPAQAVNQLPNTLDKPIGEVFNSAKGVKTSLGLSIERVGEPSTGTGSSSGSKAAPTSTSRKPIGKEDVSAPSRGTSAPFEGAAAPSYMRGVREIDVPKDRASIEQTLRYDVRRDSPAEVEAVLNALEKGGKITVYRASAGDNLTPGQYVTPFKTRAADYVHLTNETRPIYEHVVDVKDLKFDADSGDMLYRPSTTEKTSGGGLSPHPASRDAVPYNSATPKVSSSPLNQSTGKQASDLSTPSIPKELEPLTATAKSAPQSAGRVSPQAHAQEVSSLNSSISPSIPKELEPLAAEARKYGSAEEFVNALKKRTTYHATDSDFFTAFDDMKAAKGETYFNPLGRGFYTSTNKEFTRRFGKNTYEYILPDNAKIKTVTLDGWQQREYPTIINQTLRKLGIKPDDLELEHKVALNRLGNDSPISSLNEAEEYIRELMGRSFRPNQVKEAMEEVVSTRNAGYDAIRYKATDYFDDADEILIPKEKFNKGSFVQSLTDFYNTATGASGTKK